ncbi:MAG: aldo/keto reductase [Terrimicrobiaceae bacterium]|nr:aldo/keto reductase [Terrimicrobiaceae bacterium]
MSASVLAAASRLPIVRAEAPPISARATDIVDLGHGVRTTRMALGTGSSGWNRASSLPKLGSGGLGDYLRHAYDERGLAFWDSADQYGTHPGIREALKGVPREKVVILTKTSSDTSTADGMRKDLDRFRQEMGVDVIDILLLHCLTDPGWPEKMRGAMDAVDEAQSKGIVRLKGVSCHSLGALQAAAKEPWVEVDLARINPHGSVMDAPPDQVVPVLREMKKAGKTVIGMKVYGAGKHAALRESREECLRFVTGLGCVDAFTIGCNGPAQLKDTLASLGG